jgi:hypothetical protein
VEHREAVRAFLVWAAGHGHIPRALAIPSQPPSAGPAITQLRRLDLLRRFAASTDAPARPSAAACLLLLYAQPLTRIRGSHRHGMASAWQANARISALRQLVLQVPAPVIAGAPDSTTPPPTAST